MAQLLSDVQPFSYLFFLGSLLELRDMIRSNMEFIRIIRICKPSEAVAEAASFSLCASTSRSGKPENQYVSISFGVIADSEQSDQGLTL